MIESHISRLIIAMSLFFGSFVLPAHAQECGRDGSGFRAWIESFKERGRKQGLTDATLKLLDGVSYSSRVIALDRNQKSFKLSFGEFYARRVNDSLIRRGRALWAENRQLFDAVEERFGVPAPVIIAIWGLETNYGKLSGNLDILTSLATLSYDCRRSTFFEPNLVGALMIIQRGDMPRAKMRGAWAGEIGQTQFMPANYIKYGMDADGDGRSDLVSSIPDVIASTANFLKGHGWKGREWGPGTANYEVIRQWNKAAVYFQTNAVMADKIAAP